MPDIEQHSRSDMVLKADWDVFVSHASEDKDAIARPLAERLKKLGLKVWYDEAELKIGDSLTRAIDRGLSRSSYGIVVLSNSFFGKGWTEYEFRGLVAKSIGDEKTILPVWHDISREDVIEFSPSLADTLAGNTADGVDKLAVKLLNVIRPDLHQAVQRRLTAYKAGAKAIVREIPIRDIDIGPVQHIRLSKELEQRVRLIRHVLLDVEQMSLAEWMDGFQRDIRPAEEIKVWEWIAAKYAVANQAYTLTDADKRNLFAGLIVASLGSYDKADEKFSEILSVSRSNLYKSLFDESDLYFPLTGPSPSKEWLNLFAKLDADNFDTDPTTIDFEYIKYLSRQN